MAIQDTALFNCSHINKGQLFHACNHACNQKMPLVLHIVDTPAVANKFTTLGFTTALAAAFAVAKMGASGSSFGMFLLVGGAGWISDK